MILVADASKGGVNRGKGRGGRPKEAIIHVSMIAQRSPILRVCPTILTVDSSSYFDSHYDVVIVGAALAGLSAALELAKAGKKILILEQHNLPGGVATSYLRGGAEIEAALHEMMSIGEKESPLQIRAFLEGHGVDIDWVRVPDAFRYVDDETDVVIHSGKNGDIATPAKDIARACGEETEGEIYKKVLDFLSLCQRVDRSCKDLQANDRGTAYIALHHQDLAFTSGYDSRTVMEAFRLPKKAIDILSAYWIYLGTPASKLPFSVYAVVLSEYLGNGSYIPRHTSFEMSLKMAERVREMGAQIEYGQRVDKILTDKKGIRGVRTASGAAIGADVVLCGAYPNTVYSRMLEGDYPLPKRKIQATHAKQLGVSAFSVILLLDKTAGELGIKDYATFLYLGGDHDEEAFEKGKTEGPYSYLACVCPNVIIGDASPKGTCLYSMTYLPNGGAFAFANEENYAEITRKNAAHFIESASRFLGKNLRDHILEIATETPVSVAHYTGAFMGTIYGYSHHVDAHIVARTMNKKDEANLPGLYFIGAHHIDGDGMAPVINSGIHVAREVLKKGGRK